MSTAWTYDELVAICSDEDGVVGLVLTGSRGRRAFVHEESDWDVRLVVRDADTDAYVARLGTPHGSQVEVVVFSLSDFERVGEIGTESAWDRYSYVRAHVVLDKLDGRIAELVEAKSTLAPEAALSLAAENLDDYINAYYRSAKNLRSALDVEARLDAAESIAPLLTTLFALHGRVRPFNRFLRWELEAHPFDARLGQPIPCFRGSRRSSLPETSASSNVCSATSRSSLERTASAMSSTAGSPTSPGCAETHARARPPCEHLAVVPMTSR